MSTTVVILNPLAGSGEDLPALRQALGRLGAVEILETEREGHAEELARAAAEGGAERVVAAGGDGTLNEVLNGLGDHLGAVRLGILPIGTGNDFVRSIGVPEDWEGAIDLLARGHTHRIDVARVEVAGRRRLFLNMSAGGFSQEINEALDPELKRRWGALAYVRSAANALPELRAYRTTLEIDDETVEIDAYLIVVANARFVAAGIPAAPQARLDDGLLDVIVFPEMAAVELLIAVPRALLGLHLGGDGVLFRRARRLTVSASPPVAFNADGELLAAATTTFDVLPRALEVVVGRLAQEGD